MYGRPRTMISSQQVTVSGKRPPLPRRTMDARRGIDHVAFSPAALLLSVERRHMLLFIDHHEV